MKKFLSLFLIALLFIGLIRIPAMAEVKSQTQKYSEVPTIGTKSKDKDKATGSVRDQDSNIVTTLDTVLIQFGECSISNNNDGTVYAYGKTLSGYIIEEIGYTIYLQVWNGYSWTNVYSKKVSKYNTTMASQYDKVSVQKGKYYRVSVDHYAVDYSSSDSCTSTSDYVYVN